MPNSARHLQAVVHQHGDPVARLQRRSALQAVGARAVVALELAPREPPLALDQRRARGPPSPVQRDQVGSVTPGAWNQVMAYGGGR